jgi:multiple sugar transport system substrate-binding protein
MAFLPILLAVVLTACGLEGIVPRPDSGTEGTEGIKPRSDTGKLDGIALRTVPDTGKTFTGTLRVGVHSKQWMKDPYPPDGKWYEPYHPMKTRSKAFMERYPGVMIEFVDVDYDKNFKQLLQDPSQMPDVMELTVNEARLPMRDHLISLADHVEDMEGWQGDYMKLIEFAEFDGEPYLLPLTSNPVMMFYIVDIFDNFGIEKPREGWTWDDFVRISRQLIDAGFSVWPGPFVNEIEPIINAFGGRYTDERGRFVGAMDSPDTVNAFVRYAEMFSAVTTPDQWPNPVVFEKRALTIDRATRVAQDYLRVAVAPIPDAADGRRYNNSLMTGLAITKHSRQPELAWEYIKFMLGESSEEAIDAVVDYTFGDTVTFAAFGRKPETLEELKQWMRHEITISPPASFDFAWTDQYRPSSTPFRPFKQYYEYVDAGFAQTDLSLWAKEVESYAEVFAGTDASGGSGGGTTE